MTHLVEHHRNNCCDQNYDRRHGFSSVSIDEVLQIEGLSQNSGVVISTSHSQNNVENLHSSNQNGNEYCNDRWPDLWKYDFEKDLSYENRIQFLYELCEELSIDTGNKYDKLNLIMKTDWGSSYMPTESEVDNKIIKLSADLKYLKSLKKDIQDSE